MRNHGFFLRLALVNVIRNRRFYGPYLLSCGGTAAMYYMLRFLAGTEVLATVRGAAYLQSMMAIGCGVAALFAGVILLYANSFVMKRRQRELGVYHVLGLEKRHLARVMGWEALLCAAGVLALGLAGGILLSRLLPPLLLGLVHLPVEFHFFISGKAAWETGTLFLALFVLTLAVNLLHMSRSRPVELLRSVQTGEREPRTKWLLSLIGAAALAGGYGLAVTIQDPVEAMIWFFGAVGLVMLGTYCLFTAGSIAVLKGLRANRRFYYQTRHFTAVSGLLYRMKQNAAGLSNICILSTMVLVTVSTTACLYLGLQEIVTAQAARLQTVEREALTQEYYAMYGGFLFLGLVLGGLFLLTTALIIYYKQLSEGYEDRRRYQILEQVGMTPGEVGASIRSQILLVFFLPLGMAGLHLLAASPMLCRMLELFGLRDAPLFAACAAGTLLVFCAVYTLVFGATARTYRRVVSERTV